jgi:hypothetical protein
MAERRRLDGFTPSDWRTMHYLYLILIPALMLAGCNHPAEPTAEPPLDLSTPGRTLESLASVWTDYREIDSYRRLLSPGYPQAYCFYFDPRIIPPLPPQTGPYIPQSWTYMEDVFATSNMFSSAYDIRLELLNAGDFDDPGISGDFYRADNVQIQFYLWRDNADFYYFAAGLCDFEFRKVGDVWLISSWYDRTGGTESAQSLGELRFPYR